MLSGYRAMWLVVMFDLPVVTKPQRRVATEFRKSLIQDGFEMMQYSVYFRPCPTDENAEVHVQRVRVSLPTEGKVRVLKITDKQFGRMLSFFGRKTAAIERMPGQLGLF